MNKKIITIEQYKEDNTRYLQHLLATNGGFNPLITGLIVQADGSNTLVIAPIPQELVKDSESKLQIPKLVRSMFEKFKEEGITPICFSFTSEAWIRQLEKDQKPPKNWQELPKKEAFITCYETANTTELCVNYIHREGKIADEDGNLIDAIRLERVPEMEATDGGTYDGVLVNMFRKELKKLEEDGKSTD